MSSRWCHRRLDDNGSGWCRLLREDNPWKRRSGVRNAASDCSQWQRCPYHVKLPALLRYFIKCSKFFIYWTVPNKWLQKKRDIVQVPINDCHNGNAFSTDEREWLMTWCNCWKMDKGFADGGPRPFYFHAPSFRAFWGKAIIPIGDGSVREQLLGLTNLGFWNWRRINNDYSSIEWFKELEFESKIKI